MPALKNKRHELFAQAIAHAADPADAYRSAGYDVTVCSAEAGAMRLRKNPTVAARIAELGMTPAPAYAGDSGAVAETTGTSDTSNAAPAAPSVASALRELEEARKVAIAKGQAAAAISAIMAKAKLAGLLAERPDSAPPQPTAFDGNYTEAARRIAFLLRLAEEERESFEPVDESH
jgi:hypothetical protein